ncbi:MAG: hypothetical protein ACO3DQ_01120, partial [Cephaloticoccus sp.]
LVLDDYYQRVRDERLYGQGVARGDATLRKLSNFYSPKATAIPNGTFVLAGVMADEFAFELGHEPISRVMLARADAYLLICPVKTSAGGRAEITDADADLLRDYVRDGGMLIVVGNSATDFAKADFDFAAMNRIGRRFGVEFQESMTHTLSIPIAPDHPRFDGVRDLIFGNGATFALAPEPPAELEVLLESRSEFAAGPVAVLAKLGRGRALFLGDGGTLGNAHMIRTDIDHAPAVRQLLETLLADGPAPRYGWKPGLVLTADVHQEQVLSGYPEMIDFFRLPHPAGTQAFSSGMRQLDLENAGGRLPATEKLEFVSLVSAREAQVELAVGDSAGGGFVAQWRRANGELAAQLLPNGRFLSPKNPDSATLGDWQQVLLHEAVLAPLRAAAEAGAKWTATLPTSLPQFQLGLVPRVVAGPADLHYAGVEELGGVKCHRFTRRTYLDGSDWRLEDLIDREAAVRLGSLHGLKTLSGGQMLVAHYWVDAATLLPVRTELEVSASLWWKDPRLPGHYIGMHDSKNYEEWETVTFVTTYGRKLTVDFRVK